MLRKISDSKKNNGGRAGLPDISIFRGISSAFGRSLFIITVYLLFGLSWIIITDSINFTLSEEITSMAFVSLLKGSLYVILTAGLIFGLTYSAFKKISIHQAQLEKSNSELVREQEKLLLSEKMLRESQTLLRAIFDQATVGISIGSSEDAVVPCQSDKPDVNPAFIKITGRTAAELQKLSWGDLTYPDDLKDDYVRLEKLQTGEIYDAEKRLILPDGSPVWVHMIISPVYLNGSPTSAQLCIIEDISRRKELESSLNEHVRSRTVLLDNLQGMAYRCRYDGGRSMQYVSQGAYALTGYRQDSLISNYVSFYDLIAPEYREGLDKSWKKALASRMKLKEEYEIKTAAGDNKWVLEQGEGVFDERGNVVALEGLVIDITKQKEQELTFKYFSEHDFNTGLKNWRYFKKFISDALTPELEDIKHALILVHISKMNLLNLTHGFLYGEQLVKELSIMLSRLCGESCSLFQIDIDRFVFYVSAYDSRAELAAICKSAIAIFEQRLPRFYIQVGVVEIDGTVRDADCLLKYASIAAANNGKDGLYSFFSSEMEVLLQRRETILSELSEEICGETEGKLFVEYQPIVESAFRRITGFEALARFKSDAFGLVPPSEFIAIAEEEHIIIPLGRKIILQAFDFLKTLQDSGFGDVSLSINLSPIQLLREDFIPEFKQIIADKDVAPKNLVVEITESVFSDNYEEMNEKLEALHAMGIRVAIDDFGTGYSSLARERELKVNCLKIDKYFIDNLCAGDERTITADIISMAHKLGHSVVAEGVENEAQERYLALHQCDYMQGYLFSQPLSKERALKTLL